MKAAAFILAGLLGLAPFASCQPLTDNSKLMELFNADQAARLGKDADWAKVRPEDDKRREEVHRMLDAGEVRTGNDYFRAALVYQHGERHEDFLLAHVLAVDALSLGNKRARWLAAATLDRYLLSVYQPQIYGTQFEYSQGKSAPWNRRTMNPSLLNDSTRGVVCVVSALEQDKILDEVKGGGPLRSASIADCK